ncbi:MAG: flagellar hook-associated protein FlgK [bacterium]|nr:flagellar hook-associated protein FlgK [bacterium]
MGNIFGIMDIGAKALRAQQLALEVTSHNIANADTPGYTKQTAVLETTTPVSAGPAGFSGTGVDVAAIQRAYDKFTNAQINLENEAYGSAQGKHDLLQSVERVFNESSTAGVANAMSEFFSAWQGLSANPAGSLERQAVLARGDQLASAFQSAYRSLLQAHGDGDQAIAGTVDEINRLASDIAALNQDIHDMEGGGSGAANDLRDRRDYLLTQLSNKVGVTTFEADNGMVTVTLAGGPVLIESARANTLTPDVENGRQVINFSGSGGMIEMTGILKTGALGGMISARDDHIQAYMDALGDLAGAVAVEVNKTHLAGYGLDGSTNTLFFEAPAAVTGADSANTGGAAIGSGTVTDPAQLTADDYEIRFTAPASYDVVNITTGAAVVTGEAYSSGTAIATVPGISFAISDGGSGPAAGDRFTVSMDKDQFASVMAVSSAVAGSPEKIAAAEDDPLLVSGAGDNRNALAVAGLASSLTVAGGSTSPLEFYAALVSRVGQDVDQAGREAAFGKASLAELENLRDAISGVSIDEEMVNLIKFQNAYAAGARLIKVGTDLLDILVNLGR